MRIFKNAFRASLASLSPKLSNQLIALLELNIGVGTGAHSYDSGESLAIEWISTNSTDHLTIFDVGANAGQYTHLLRTQLANRDFTIHAFEPSSIAFRKFEKQHAEDPRVHANQLGVSSEPGQATLFADQAGSTLASLSVRDIHHHGIDHGATQESVAITTIGDYCNEKNIDKIDLLKIDVEGWELSVLKGAEAMISKDQVKLIQFEFGGANIDTRTFFRDFYDFFQHHNFKLFRLAAKNHLIPMSSYSEHCERYRCQNFLAVSPKLAATLDLPMSS